MVIPEGTLVQGTYIDKASVPTLDIPEETLIPIGTRISDESGSDVPTTEKKVIEKGKEIPSNIIVPEGTVIPKELVISVSEPNICIPKKTEIIKDTDIKFVGVINVEVQIK